MKGFEYRFDSLNLIEQFVSWVKEQTDAEVLHKGLTKVILDREVRYKDDTEERVGYFILSPPRGNIKNPVLWIAPQTGSYGEYWAALLAATDISNPARVYVTSSDQQRLQNLISLVRTMERNNDTSDLVDITHMDSPYADEITHIKFKRNQDYEK